MHDTIYNCYDDDLIDEKWNQGDINDSALSFSVQNIFILSISMFCSQTLFSHYEIEHNSRTKTILNKF